MCIVSNIADDWTQRFPERWPMIPSPNAVPPHTPGFSFTMPDLSKYATKEDLDKLRKEIELVRDLIIHAQKVDEETGQPHCDKPDKFRLIKALARRLGVDLSGLKLNE